MRKFIKDERINRKIEEDQGKKEGNKKVEWRQWFKKFKKDKNRRKRAREETK